MPDRDASCNLVCGSRSAPHLFGVRRLDPLTFTAGAALLLLAALLAAWGPARRTSRVDLLVALRLE